MLVEAKSNLARLMATENLVVEERNVPTAYFDMKSRILTVPILNGNLSNHLYDLLLGHEVGHALETPAQGWHDSVVDLKVNKDILNVCEDARIEKKIKRKFPGLKLSFVRGYQELMDMDFFDVRGKDLNKLNFIDRVNMYTKGGASQGIEFSAEETVLLREVESTETWEDVVIVAKKIQEFMKEKLKEIPQIKTKVKIVSDDGDEDGEGEEMTGEQVQVDVDTKDIQGEKIKSKADIDEGEGEGQSADGESENNVGETEDGSGTAGGTTGTDENIESKTDKSFREKEKQLYDVGGKKESIYTEIPKLNLDQIVVPYKVVLSAFVKHNEQAGYRDFYHPEKLKQEFVKFKNESNKIVSYLVKEFELRKNADQQSRAKVSKTGELNMNKIHEYRITDDIFERLTKVPNGKSHGLVMFIDWSGSMHEHLNSTVKQLLNLVMFCKKVNIPFDVYAFTTQWDTSSKKQTPKIGTIVTENFSLVNILSSKMTAKEYSTMSSFLLDIGTGYRKLSCNHSVPDCMSLGGTPLNSSIIAAFDLIPEFREKNKLQIVNAVFLTDGESNTLSARYSYVDNYGTYRTDRDLIPTINKRSFIRDPKTKAIVEVAKGSGYGSDSAQQTKALLSLLKQHAECNLIGFFIADSRSIRTAMELYGDYDKDFYKRKQKVEERMTQFRKEKTFVIEDFGYDEYYLIRSNTLDTDDEELKVNSNTTRGLVSAFSKYTEGKISSRIILNRFIKLIA